MASFGTVRISKKKQSRLKNNREYWIEKITENINRDTQNDRLLRELGWIPIHFWSKDVEKNTLDCVKEIEEVVAYQIKNYEFE